MALYSLSYIKEIKEITKLYMMNLKSSRLLEY